MTYNDDTKMDHKKCDLCNHHEWVICDEFSHFLESDECNKVKEGGGITADSRNYEGDMFYCSGCKNVVNQEMISLLQGSLIKVITTVVN